MYTCYTKRCECNTSTLFLTQQKQSHSCFDAKADWGAIAENGIESCAKDRRLEIWLQGPMASAYQCACRYQPSASISQFLDCQCDFLFSGPESAKRLSCAEEGKDAEACAYAKTQTEEYGTNGARQAQVLNSQTARSMQSVSRRQRPPNGTKPLAFCR